MFAGWLSYAGTEILNEERVRAYMREMVPNIKTASYCGDDKGLAELLDDKPYALPALDDAPWVDPDDPDTLMFCGAYPLSVSGLTDSPRSATVLQNMGDGGAISGQRLATKEVRVTALLLAQTDAALEAGKRWLSAALDGGCDPCAPADLCFLVGTGADSIALGDYATQTIARGDLIGSLANWNSATGSFTPATTSDEVRTPEAPSPLPCDEIFWHWNIASATAGTTVVFETIGETGVTNTVTAVLGTGASTVTIGDRGQSDTRSWSRMRVTSAPGETVVVDSVDTEFRTDADEDVCFAKYARQLRLVKCVSGPTTIEEYAPSSGAMEKVEFVFVAEAPHVYGLEQDVVSMTGSAVTRTMPGSDVIVLNRMVAACTLTSTLGAPIADPDCPPVPVPPRVDTTTSSCATDPTGFRSYALAIPDSAIPLWSDVVPVVRITTNTSPARKVQVRFLPRPFDIQIAEDLDPCSACGEFVIDYIPPNSTFVLNGLDERAYIEQQGGVISEAGHLLSGMTSTTLFSWPVLTCGTGYLAVVDVAAEGVGSFSVSVAVRQ